MPFMVVHFTRVSSTQEIAKRILKENTVIVADTMDGGYGRSRRRWFAPFGGLWISIILRPAKDVQLLTLSTGVAVVEGLKKFNVNANLKWPNDVIYHGKKLCGILGEMQGDFVIMGIGMNLKNEIPDEIKNTAVGVPSIDRDEILPVLLENVEKRINDTPEKTIESWKKYDMTLGKKVRVIDGNKIHVGIAKDVAMDGHLIIETPDGDVDVYTGDLRIIQNGDHSDEI